jgi:hypothetical protein
MIRAGSLMHITLYQVNFDGAGDFSCYIVRPRPYFLCFSQKIEITDLVTMFYYEIPNLTFLAFKWKFVQWGKTHHEHQNP